MNKVENKLGRPLTVNEQEFIKKLNELSQQHFEREIFQIIVNPDRHVEGRLYGMMFNLEFPDKKEEE